MSAKVQPTTMMAQDSNSDLEGLATPQMSQVNPSYGASLGQLD